MYGIISWSLERRHSHHALVSTPIGTTKLTTGATTRVAALQANAKRVSWWRRTSELASSSAPTSSTRCIRCTAGFPTGVTSTTRPAATPLGRTGSPGGETTAHLVPAALLLLLSTATTRSHTLGTSIPHFAACSTLTQNVGTRQPWWIIDTLWKSIDHLTCLTKPTTHIGASIGVSTTDTLGLPVPHFTTVTLLTRNVGTGQLLLRHTIGHRRARSSHALHHGHLTDLTKFAAHVGTRAEALLLKKSMRDI